MDYSYMTNKQGEKVLLHGLNIILSIVNISYAMKLYTFNICFDAENLVDLSTAFCLYSDFEWYLA